MQNLLLYWVNKYTQSKLSLNSLLYIKFKQNLCTNLSYFLLFKTKQKMTKNSPNSLSIINLSHVKYYTYANWSILSEIEVSN